MSVCCFRTDIVPVQVEDIAKKPTADKIIPGRVVRRAKRQTSSQTSYEGRVYSVRSHNLGRLPGHHR